MIRALWIARTGLDANQTHLDVISNNIANVSTPGFKRVRPVFEDLIYQNLRQAGAQSTQQTQIANGLQIGTGVQVVATTRIHTQGNLSQTGNELDVAIDGQGFFQITMPDGTTAYTRDGQLRRDSTGQLATSSGFPLADGIVLPADTQAVTIGKDGTVSVTQPGQAAPTQIGNIQLATFVNPAGLQAIGENLFIETAASGTATPNTPTLNGAGQLLQGNIETANVNVAEELVSLIQSQRAYELNSRAIQTADQMLGRLTQL